MLLSAPNGTTLVTHNADITDMELFWLIRMSDPINLAKPDQWFAVNENPIYITVDQHRQPTV